MNNAIRVARQALVVIGVIVAVGHTAAEAATAHGRRATAGRAASAAKRSRPPRTIHAALSAGALDKVRQLLGGDDPVAIAATAKALGDSEAPNASVPLVELLAAGTQPAAAVAALAALKSLHDPSSIEIVTLYAGNRTPEVRREAVRALGAFSEARVVPTLMDRLGDTAPDVRATAAEALAIRNEKGAAPRLLALLKRNDAGAAAPLGTIAPVAMLPSITELQGSIDDANLATALGEFVKRHDVAESLRLDIVKTLARVPGAASTTALVEYVGTLTGGDTHASKVEAEKIIDERSKQK